MKQEYGVWPRHGKKATETRVYIKNEKKKETVM